MADIVSRPYRPDPRYCCEGCVFGTGEHGSQCPILAKALGSLVEALKKDAERPKTTPKAG